MLTKISGASILLVIPIVLKCDLAVADMYEDLTETINTK